MISFGRPRPGFSSRYSTMGRASSRSHSGSAVSWLLRHVEALSWVSWPSDSGSAVSWLSAHVEALELGQLAQPLRQRRQLVAPRRRASATGSVGPATPAAPSVGCSETSSSWSWVELAQRLRQHRQLVAGEVEALELRQLAQPLRQRRQLVARHVEALELRQLAQRLRQRRQLVVRRSRFWNCVSWPSDSGSAVSWLSEG